MILSKNLIINNKSSGIKSFNPFKPNGNKKTKNTIKKINTKVKANLKMYELILPR